MLTGSLFLKQYRQADRVGDWCTLASGPHVLNSII
jgi:hypothetical protein